ncbi:MAG TPA: CpsD/CapB family tyrosine-protein kinase, partial [Allocoleopsis sp.]
GGLLGLLLGIGAALALERLTDVVYTSEEFKRIVGQPLLASIPLNESLQMSNSSLGLPLLQRVTAGMQPATEDETRTNGKANNNRDNGRRYYNVDPFFESFRTLYANIRLLNSDSPIRSLVVSSTQPAEGKSTVAIHLAKAAAAMAQRVLLVDLDLRSPKLHEYMSLPPSGGLVDVIAGDLSLKDAVQRSPLEPNLFVLVAGAIPPDSTRLLSSQKMQRLMEQFQSNFDLVIYDAPPLVGFADAYLTAANTNGMILVAETGRLKRSLLEQALEQIKLSRTTLLGVVAQKQPFS